MFSDIIVLVLSIPFQTKVAKSLHKMMREATKSILGAKKKVYDRAIFGNTRFG